MQQAAMGVDDGRGLGDGLDHPGLVIGQHQAHQRRFAERAKHPVEFVQIDDTVAIHRNDQRILGRIADRRMFGGRDQDVAPAGAPQDRGIGLGRA